MTGDLLAALVGREERDDPRPEPQDVVTRMRCSCGRVVALLSRCSGRTWLWRASYKHTPRGAADLVAWAALQDFEALARIAREQPDLVDADLVAEVEALHRFVSVATPERLASVLPALRLPARRRDVTGLAAEVAGWQVGRSADLAPLRPAHMEAGCNTCRSVYDVGAVVVELEPMPGPPRSVVVEDRPPLGVEGMSIGWPEGARAGRVALYRELSDVLAS